MYVPVGQISAGDTSPWVFCIFQTQSPRKLVIRCVDIDPSKTNAITSAKNYIARDLVNATKPLQRPGNSRPSPLGARKYQVSLTISFQDQNFNSISTSMIVLSKSSDPFPTVEDNQSYTNYSKCIDTALGTMIGAHAVVIDRIQK